MATLYGELTLAVGWSQRAEDLHVLASSGAGLPFESDAVAGCQEVKEGSTYEIELLNGPQRILHAAGTVPPLKETQTAQPTYVADAWIRCSISAEGALEYEIHLGPAGMDQPKAVHKGRMNMAVAG